jgi:uncharacterized protein (TIGR02246 family)
MRRMAILAVCCALWAGPALAQSKAFIQKLNDEWADAFNKGDAKAVAEMYADDAYVLPPGSDMLKGRAAIEKFWQQEIQHLGNVKITTIDVRKLGPLAVREIGTASFTTKAQPPHDGELQYAVVWHKEDGHWKLLQDIWNVVK